MKTIDIIGANYFGAWTDERTACRAVIIQDGRMLLSYETRTGQWMLPGGGLEEGETQAQCVAREVAEETGVAIRPGACALEIDEYYEGWKFVNRYFLADAVGAAPMRLTERELEVGMEPRWLPVDEIMAIFAGHQSWADTDEMRRGMYLREYTALTALLGRNAPDDGAPLEYVALRDRPALEDRAAAWFSGKWGPTAQRHH